MKKIQKDFISKILPLTPLQEGILFHYLKEPDGDLYIEQLSLQISGEINIPFFKKAWELVVQNNDMLRAVYRWEKLKSPIQIILKDLKPEIIFIDLSNLKKEERETLLEETGINDREKKFDLRKGAFRITICKLATNQFIVIICNHHIILDGWSTGIILEESLSIYKALVENSHYASPFKTGFTDYIKWIRKTAENENEAKAFWSHYLENIENKPVFLSKNTPKPQKQYRLYCSNLDGDKKNKIEHFIKSQKITTASLLYGTWGLLLQRYGNSEDVIFGTTVSGRPPQIKGIEKSVGLFINTIPLRANAGQTERLDTWLKQLDQSLKARQDHELTALIKIREYAGTAKTEELFDSLAVIENYPLDKRLSKGSHPLKVKGYKIWERTHYPLTLTIALSDQIIINYIYQESFFDNWEIKALAGYFESLLEYIIENPDGRIVDACFLKEKERSRLLIDFNNTAKPYPSGKTIHRVFEEQVKKSPHAIALVGEEIVIGETVYLTYGELNRKSQAIATEIIAAGAGPGSIVAIRGHRSIDIVIAIFAILKSGAAYMPIDPVAPNERTQYMLADSGAAILLTSDELNGTHVQNLNSFSGKGIDPAPAELAYIIYTSGSTGKPKGVLIDHKSALNTLYSMHHNYPFTCDHVYLLKTAYMFDVSVAELFGWFFGGGHLAVLERGGEKDPGQIMAAIDHYRITHINFVPAQFSVFLEILEPQNIKKLNSLLYIFLAGEELSPRQVELFQSYQTSISLKNIYGPTEASIYATSYSLPQDRAPAVIPIGLPLANTRCFILDRCNRLQPIGVPGELHLAGAGLARGYLNRPELTAEHFIQYTGYPQELLQKDNRLYRTGDLARFLPNGNIEFLGRMDSQVKIRGFRIEIGEIEHWLSTYSQVSTNLVLTGERQNKDKYLCAYIVLRNKDFKKDLSIENSLREYLAGKLPVYMVPDHFVFLDSLPLNANGKLDRKALPKPEMKASDRFEPPNNETEKQLATLWADLFAINEDQISIYDNFFHQGGHSLNAVQLIGRIQKLFNIEIQVSEIFTHSHIKGLATLIESRTPIQYSSIPLVPDKNFYQLSSSQKRIYILQQIDKSSIAYNMSSAYKCSGRLEKELLEQTFRSLIQRHQILRTSFSMRGDEPVQIISHTPHFEIETIPYHTSNQEVIEKFIRPFDLSQEPLLRVGLTEINPEEHIMMLDMHHIIADGKSIAILINEFVALINGKTLPTPTIQYKDFATWQNRNKKKESYKARKEYWLNQFQGEIPVLKLSNDYLRLTSQDAPGASLEFEIKSQTLNALSQMTQRENVTLYMVLLSTFIVFLSRLSGQEDIVVGTPVAGRRHESTHALVGMFVNTLGIRSYPKQDETFTHFLHQVKSTVLEAFDNQDYPFEELIEHLRLDRNAGGNPLFNVMFALQNMERDEVEIPGLKLTRYHYDSKTSKFDLTLRVIEVGNLLKLTIEYNTCLFAPETIKRFQKYFLGTLHSIVCDPIQELRQINILPQAEKDLLLGTFNQTQRDYPKNKSLHQLFEEQAQMTPYRLALVGEEISTYSRKHRAVQLTYRALDEKTNQLAQVLTAQGIPEGGIVAIMTVPSIETIIGIFAILKTGASYLPIDPETPVERINFMLADSGAQLLLTPKENPVPTIVPKIHFTPESPYMQNIRVTKPGEKTSNNQGKTDLPSYIIYTSGTTGLPKGVLLGHSSIVNLVWGLKERVYSQYRETQKVSLLSPYIFDASVKQIFASLLLGHSLFVIPREVRTHSKALLEFYVKQEINISDGTPSHLHILLEAMDIYKNTSSLKLKQMLVGGEELPGVLIEQFFSKLDQYNVQLPKITNVYGPTECSVDATSFEVTENNINRLNKIPLGKPMPNFKILILDNNYNLQPIGVAGEIHIAGAGLARGYLNRPELTDQQFITLKMKNLDYPSLETGKLYRTGDLARWLPNGNIEFLGRKDFQVKIRGYRIETGEIEHCLSTHPQISKALVIARKGQLDETYLCAYIIFHHIKKIQKNDLEDQLQEFLKNKLPEYMIPGYFISLNSFPLTPNGKVDRKALPEPTIKSSGRYCPPTNEREKQLTELWAHILNVEFNKIGIYDNFFHLGGHSLKAVQLAARIHKTFHVEVSIGDIFKNPTIQEISEFIENNAVVDYSRITPLENKDHYALSSAQKRLYILHQMNPEGTGYNMPGLVELKGSLNRDKLEHTFQSLIERHESFRTSFSVIHGEPVQIIYENIPFQIQIIPAQSDQNQLIDDFIRPFDLEKPPLIRVGLNNIETETHLLLIDMHHIISDGTSMGILVKEFAALYKGVQLPAQPIQYKDFAAWQNRSQYKELLHTQQTYWCQELAGEIPVLNLPCDYPRPAMQSFRGDSIKFQIDARTKAALEEIAKSEGQTLFMILLAAFNVFLARMSGQDEILVGTPVAGRRHTDLESIIGFFINTLPIKSNPAGQKSMEEFIKETGEKSISALANQDMQYEALVENLKIERNAGRNPLFDVMFVFQNMDSGKLEIPGLQIKTLPIKTGISKFDLLLGAIETGDTLSLNLEYSTDLFVASTIQRFLIYFKNILSLFINKKNQLISQIDIIPEEEKKQLLIEFNNTPVTFPAVKTIQQLFLDQAEKNPNKIAIVGPEQNKSTRENTGEFVHLSYGELKDKVQNLAGEFKHKGVGADTIVAIKSHRSIDMLLGILAILENGAVYLPIDPAAPEDRIHYILEDSGAIALLTVNEKQTFKFHHITEPSRRYDTNTGKLAYIIYTSGSTGKPKGVAINHFSAINTLMSMQRDFPFGFGDTYLLKTSYMFDVSVTELFGWFFDGGRLAILESGGEKDPWLILDTISKSKVTHINFVPSQFSAFLETLESENLGKLNSLKHIFLAGEELHPHLVKQFQSFNTTIKLENIYGPTEAAIYATRYSMAKGFNHHSIPIGKPLPNTRCYILSQSSELQPIGVVGELHLAGAGLARGYLNRPELTDQQFITLKMKNLYYPSHETDKLYRTGDLARWLPDGNIEFLGRKDFQIKIRGYRIETGEIEHCLSTHPQISKALVMARKGQLDETYLCAYIIFHHIEKIQKNDLEDQLQGFLKNKLPEYMIPGYFISLNSFPLTPNGKVDRKALPEPTIKSSGRYGPPTNEREKQLTELWAHILNVEFNKIGIYDNFFHLGGHSLKAVQLAVRIHKTFHVEVSIGDIFKNPTIQGISKFIENNAVVDYSQITPLENKDHYSLSSAQKRLYILHQMNPEETGYNMPGLVELKGSLNRDKLEHTFQSLIERHESFRTSFSVLHGEPVQIIYENIPFQIQIIPAQSDQNQLIDDFIRPFDLEKPPLIRVGLNNIETETHLLLIDMHHIISDGTSMGILVKEFAALYKGVQLPALPIQYKDFAAWQNRSQYKELLHTQQTYWRQELAGEIPVLNLPCDYPRPAMQSFRGDSIKFQIDARTKAALEEIAKSEGQTLFMILLAAFNVFLARMSGQDEILVGTPVAGRRHTDLESIIGFFINTLPIKSNPAGQKSIEEFIKETGEKSISALANQDMQYEALVENLKIERNAGRNPLFDVMFVFQNMDSGKLKIPGLQIKTLPIKTGISKFDLLLGAIETGDTLSLNLEYSTDLFSASTIQRFLIYFKNILSLFINKKNQLISQIDIIPEEEKKQLLIEFNNTQVTFPTVKTIQQLFLDQAEKSPNKIAIVGPEQNKSTRENTGGFVHLSYGELKDKVQNLAGEFKHKGVGADTIVAIKSHRSIDMLLGILAILENGAAYLPIDPAAPEDRIHYILEDSGAIALLTVNEKQTFKFHNITEPSRRHDTNTGKLAYIIYTSGSTGKPKGVAINHFSAINTLMSMQRDFPLGFGDTYLLKTSYMFDVSVTELFGWFFDGGRLAILESGGEKDPWLILDTISKSKVTHINFVPSQFSAFLETLESENLGKLNSLKHIFLAGEELHPHLVKQFQSFNTTIKLENIYGPTEAAIYATRYSMAKGFNHHSIPIGKPLPNTRCYILSQSSELQPIGVVGELHLAGAGLARGYLNRPELTDQQFITLKMKNLDYPSHETGKLYRTGDLARWLPDGNIEFLGRKDFQIKIRGLRIELGEIENKLTSHAMVKESLVTALTKTGNVEDNFLCAYVVPFPGISPTSKDMANYLAKELPAYMVPIHFLFLNALPLTTNGKVDRKSLPTPETLKTQKFTAPTNPTEIKLVEIWAELLKIEKEHIGTEHNFFDLGGNSLNIVTMLSQIHKELNMKIPFAQVFKTPTIGSIALLIETAQWINQNDRHDNDSHKREEFSL